MITVVVWCLLYPDLVCWLNVNQFVWMPVRLYRLLIDKNLFAAVQLHRHMPDPTRSDLTENQVGMPMLLSVGHYRKIFHYCLDISVELDRITSVCVATRRSEPSKITWGQSMIISQWLWLIDVHRLGRSNSTEKFRRYPDFRLTAIVPNRVPRTFLCALYTDIIRSPIGSDRIGSDRICSVYVHL